MSRWSSITVTILLTLPSLLIAAEESIAGASESRRLEPTGDYIAAIKDYKQQIEHISRKNGEFSADLFEPLLALGQAYTGTGDVELADESFDRAQHIAHRNEGVYSPKQLKILAIKTRLALQKDEPLEADRLKRFVFFINTHNLEGLEVLPAYLDLGQWYTDTGQYYRAQKILKEVVNLIQELAGESDLRLLEPLQMIARTRRLQGVCCSEKYLSQVLDIIENNDNVPQDLRATAYAELADAYTVSGKSKNAAKFYALAIQAASTSLPQEPKLITMSRKLGGARRHDTQMYRTDQHLFAGHHPPRLMSHEEQLEAAYQPPQQFILSLSDNIYDVKIKDAMESMNSSEPTQKMIGTPFQFMFQQLKTILPGSLRNESSLANISIALAFTVTETGSIRNIELTRSNAPVKLNRLMKEVVRKTRFRPALVAGQPVITHNVTLTQSFASNRINEN
jgi:TonB family protein